MDKSFIIAPPGKSAYITLTVILVIIMGLSVQMLLTLGHAPAPVLWGIAPIYVLLIALFGSMLFMMNQVQFTIRPNVLKISGDIWGRNIPSYAINRETIRRVNWKIDNSYLPIIRTCGTGLPGYLSGWFRLKNGQKTLLFVTDVNKIVYVETSLGFALMVSPQDADDFITALRGN